MNDITVLIADLPDLRQDKVKAELDHLASLATPQGMTAAEQICSAQRIDLEGLQGVQDVLLMLDVDHPKALERVSVQTSLMQRQVVKTGLPSNSTTMASRGRACRLDHLL